MMLWANSKRPIRIIARCIGGCSIWDFTMNIMTFPWSRGADCRSFTAWLLNFTEPYLPTSPIRDSCSNLSLTRKSAHLVVGFAMIYGHHRYPRVKKGELKGAGCSLEALSAICPSCSHARGRVRRRPDCDRRGRLTRAACLDG